MHVPTFLQKIYMPPSHSQSIHPCLINVICLAACQLVGGRLAQFESLFLARTRQHMDQALAYADRLLHFSWASIILSTYYGRASRVLECHNTISTAVRFALGFRLNQPVGTRIPDGLTTKEAIDLKEEKSLWYALYLLDTIIVSHSDVPGAMPDEVFQCTIQHQCLLDSLTCLRSKVCDRA
jgi:hypothetical protein